MAVEVAGQRLVVLRLTDGGAVRAFADHCPHRLVPLSAGVVDAGRLRCPYHGWEFDVDGRCVELPSSGPRTAGPPRSALLAFPVREADGSVCVLPGEPTVEPPSVEPPTVEPPTAEPRTGEPRLLTNLEPALEHAWHPVALATELEVGAAGTARLLGRDWTLWRDEGQLAADPKPHALCERWGLVWVAPRAPLTDLFPDPDADDARFVGAWLPPATTPASAGVVADNFLDVAHFPFVHAATFGAGEEKVVPPYEVTVEPYGCRSVQEQWFDNPEDPGVAAGLRPLRQRRRATYVYRAPFQLMLRLEELDAGAVKSILFFAQPEDLTSTRIYTKLLLYNIGGVPRPEPDVVANEVAFEEAVLAEDLALQRQMTLLGLPLAMRDELHVRADRLGVALRRTLAAFVARARPGSPPRP
jgi:phenylpropionate dioxygenase-like ring-hydroxylating dioxygenase large terminal subunit